MQVGDEEVLGIYGNADSTAEFIDTADVCIIEKLIRTVLQLTSDKLANVTVWNGTNALVPIIMKNMGLDDFVKTDTVLTVTAGQSIVLNKAVYYFIGGDQRDTNNYTTGITLSDVYKEAVQGADEFGGIAASQNALHAVYTEITKKVDVLAEEVIDFQSASGEVISVTNSKEAPLKSFVLYGKSVQDGIPTPEAPVEIKSVVVSEIVCADNNGNEYIATITNTQILNSNGVVADKIYKVDSTWKKDIKVAKAVFDGSDDEGWAMSATAANVFYRIATDKKFSKESSTLCNAYKSYGVCNNAETFGSLCEDYGICGRYPYSNHIFIKDIRYSTLAEFKASLQANPITVIYELDDAYATTTELSEADQIILNNLMSFDGVTNISTDSEILPFIEIEYASSDVAALALKNRNAIEEHIEDVDNPHDVTAEQVGLGNVPNVATNDQAPTYTEASTLSALSSGEKLSVAFGKIAKAISTLIGHISTKATSSILGHVKLSDSSAVTDSTGLALPATEKNASINGTLAYQIANKATIKSGNYAATMQGDGNLVIYNTAEGKSIWDSKGVKSIAEWSYQAVNGYIDVVGCVLPSTTIAAGDVKDISTGFVAPTGYTALGVVQYNMNSQYAIPYVLTPTKVHVYNRNTSSPITITPTIYVLVRKNL